MKRQDISKNKRIRQSINKEAKSRKGYQFRFFIIFFFFQDGRKSARDLTGPGSNNDNHRSKSLKDRSSKSSGSSSGVARSKSLKGTVSSYLMSKRKAE